MAELVKIEDTELTIREYNGQRVVTFKDIDTVHKRKTGTAKASFRRNGKYFQEGTDYIIITSREVKTYYDEYYDCDVPYVYDNGILLEALSYYILYKYLSRGSKHQVYSLASNSPITNPYLQWEKLKSKAIASVRNDIYNDEGWRNFFYNATFDPRR